MPSRSALRLVGEDDTPPARPPFDLNQALIQLGEYFRQNPIPAPAPRLRLVPTSERTTP